MDEEKGEGLVFFAGLMLGLAGVMRIVDAIWALRFEGNIAFEDGLVGEKIDNYGWVWLLVGIVLILAGILVIQRSQFARWIGIIAAAVAGISAMFWIPYYPIWSLVYVIVAFTVVYALAVYGGREGAEV
jgi:hypothetical protein